MDDQAILEMLERVRYRFYGKYRGSVHFQHSGKRVGPGGWASTGSLALRRRHQQEGWSGHGPAP